MSHPAAAPPPSASQAPKKLLRKRAARWIALGQSGGRDPWPDNARFIAAILIVVNHMTSYMRADSGLLQAYYFGSWGFRLPVYIVIAGYFTRADSLGGRGAVKLLRNILFVYFALYTIAWLQRGLNEADWKFNPAFPSYTLWFLVSLFTWRLMLPIFSQLRFLFPLSIAVALGVGFIGGIGHSMSLSRTIAFWPLFLVGWYLQNGSPLRQFLDRATVRLSAWIVTGVSLIAGYYIYPYLSPVYFEMRGSYTGEWGEQFAQAAIRLGILGYGAVGALALMALLPRGRISIITYVGSGSFYIYLLHPLLRKQLGAWDWLIVTNSTGQLLLLMLAWAIFGMLLGSRPVRWATRWLIQPRYEWLFRHPRQHPEHTATSPDASNSVGPVAARVKQLQSAPQFRQE